MPSAAYRLIRTAILNEKQITCVYRGLPREICPHIIGWTDGQEKLLGWQFGGETSSILPPGGQWRCLNIAEIRDVQAREGRWYSGGTHRVPQKCVHDIDLDINVHVRGRQR
jgi:hypothetical protein